jgi:putative exporter of polyketide antibiotics
MDVFVFETRDEVWTFESMLVGSSISRKLLEFQFWHHAFQVWDYIWKLMKKKMNIYVLTIMTIINQFHSTKLWK